MARLRSASPSGRLTCIAFVATCAAIGWGPSRVCAQGAFQIEVDSDAATPDTTDDEAEPVDETEPAEAAPPFVSEGEDAQARALFQAGTAYYERGEYVEAYGQFVRAYEVSQRPQLMYNASQAAERTGDLEHAIEWLERFIDSPDVAAAEREGQRPRLSNLRARFAQEASRRREREAPDEFFMPVPAFIAYLAGGAGLLTFATFGILTLHEDSSLSDRCRTRPCTSRDLHRLHGFAHGADAGWIIGVAGVATGTLLWLTLKDDSTDDESVAFEPWLSPRLVGASARLHF